MGKHSLEKEKKRSRVKKEKKKINIKKEIVAILIVVALVFGINFILSHREIKNDKEEPNNMQLSNSKTIEGEKLVIKSNSEYNRIVEYTFENNILKSVKMYEQFEEKEKFETRKKNYEARNEIIILNVNEEDLSIEIEKKDFGTDNGKSYEEIYDKYVVQIIGAYEVI